MNWNSRKQKMTTKFPTVTNMLASFLIVAIGTISPILLSSFSPAVVSAAGASTCDPTRTVVGQTEPVHLLEQDQIDSCNACRAAGLNPDAKSVDAAKSNAQATITCLKNNPIIKDLNQIIKVIAGIIGVVIVGMVIAGGIEYSLGGGNPDALGKAKKRIASAIVALIAFIFMYAFLNWLAPGGIL